MRYKLLRELAIYLPAADVYPYYLTLFIGGRPMLTVDKFPIISSCEELASLVSEAGFIPFFDCGIPGFSVKDVCDRAHWFVDGVDGPWEWKSGASFAYAKLLRGKAVFISPEWYGIFACYRRDGYDFEGMYEDGLLPHGALKIIKALEGGSVLSADLRERTGLTGKGSGFDSIIGVLQMKCFVLPSAFEYAISKQGLPYGWGLARYALSDEKYGAEIAEAEREYTPAEARELIVSKVAELCPKADRKRIERLIK